MARKARKRTVRRQFRFSVPRNPTDTVQLKLRFSEGLRRRLVREARSRNYSLNTEIISRLERSLESEALHDTSLSTVMAKALLRGLNGVVLRELVRLFLEDEAEAKHKEVIVEIETRPKGA
jgi:uncharacterized protein (UPF0335 family)